jgi:hypothetical protein
MIGQRAGYAKKDAPSLHNHRKPAFAHRSFGRSAWAIGTCVCVNKRDLGEKTWTSK